MIKAVFGRRAGFKGWAQQVHIGLFQRFAPFVAIAGMTRGRKVLPGVLPSHMSGQDVINGEVGGFFAAILAGVVIPTQDFPFRESQAGSRPLHHVHQTDHRRGFKFLNTGANHTPPIDNHFCFLGHNKGDGTPHVTGVKRLKINVQEQHRLIQQVQGQHTAKEYSNRLEQRQRAVSRLAGQP